MRNSKFEHKCHFTMKLSRFIRASKFYKFSAQAGKKRKSGVMPIWTLENLVTPDYLNDARMKITR